MQLNHTENIIEVHALSYAYADGYALRNISLDIHKGDYLGIIGPNGGGKTTLLKLMLGLLKPTSGKIELFGRSIQSFKDWYKVGYIPQKATQFDGSFPVTVEEVVMMGTYAKRGLFRFPTQEDRDMTYTALEQVGMLGSRKKQIGDLSGGQQQRVFIARALVTNPEVIFLDEPTVGVDSKTQEQFYLLLRKLNKDLHHTLVLVSHELDIVARETTEVAFINGELVSYCTPQELIKRGGLERLYGKGLKYIIHDHGARSRE